MSYHRGGKVWLDGNGIGWVALEKDWSGDSLPEDLVSENGLIGVDFRQVDYKTRAAVGGYAKFEGKWFFFFPDQSIEFHNLQGNPIYLLGDFNNWQPSSTYELTRMENGLGISLDEEVLNDFDQFEFKFLSGDGRWIDPHKYFPSFAKDGSATNNNWFDKHRTGGDLFTFRVIETQGLKGVSQWIKTRPNGKFGFSRKNNESFFRIFSPRAELVELVIFEKPSKDGGEKFPMYPSEDGSWSWVNSGDLTGKYYQFHISQRDQQGRVFTKEIVDPYARATVERKGPGIVIDPPRPARSQKFVPPLIEDCIVVEAHLRDLLAEASYDLSDCERLGFNGLSKWLQSENCYLRKLGANVVELLPIQEFDARDKKEYHWGYMPVNFFAPASVYASNPENGSAVEEFVGLVHAFHQAGLAVVLDVVYNHVGIPPHLIHIDREIYCSTDEDENLTNFSGCGNDLRCDSEPVKKLIIDSLVYWVEFFDVDGFRFDLGELLGVELLAEIEAELKKIKPGILLFAEPWSFRGRLPVEMNQTSYALWSDACREQLLNFAKNQSGRDSVVELLETGLDKQNLRPCQSVNYLESHDDYSLVDRFRDLSIWEDQTSIPEEVVGRVMMAMGLLLVSPGVPMLSAGQDFLRHKRGIRNTYLLGEVNALKYPHEELYKREVRFIRELIRLRIGEPGRRARQTLAEEWQICTFSTPSSAVIAFAWESKVTQEKFLITANAGLSEAEISLPDSWRTHSSLLVGYRSNGDCPRWVGPLSFSWFTFK